MTEREYNGKVILAQVINGSEDASSINYYGNWLIFSRLEDVLMRFKISL
jgi:hypothetical protein